MVHGILLAFAQQVTTARTDLSQFPVTYYFQSGEPQTGFAGAISYVAQIADRASKDEREEIRLAGIALGGAIEDLAQYVGESFLPKKEGSTMEVLHRYAEQHFESPMGG